MNKNKRRLRKLENRRKDIESKKMSWDSGKLIYENHNNEYFTPDFSLKFVKRVADKVRKVDTEFYKLTEHAINAVLLFNPVVERNDDWYFLKSKLEEYWDGK